MLQIVKPQYRLVDLFIAMCKDYNHHNDLSYPYVTKDKALKKIKSDILFEKGQVPKGNVRSLQYWFVDEENNIAGTSRFRPLLNDRFRHIGGNIGYDVSPSYRNKGIGKEILSLMLNEAKRMKLDRVLLTCDANNIASSNIIESQKGILEKIVINDKTGAKVKRYWIKL